MPRIYYDTARARLILSEFELHEDEGIVLLAIKLALLVVFLPVRLLNCWRVAPGAKGLRK